MLFLRLAPGWSRAGLSSPAAFPQGFLPSPPARACHPPPQLSPRCEMLRNSQDLVVNRLPCAGFGIVNGYTSPFLSFPGEHGVLRVFLGRGGLWWSPLLWGSPGPRIPPSPWQSRDVPHPGESSHREQRICSLYRGGGVEPILHLTL